MSDTTATHEVRYAQDGAFFCATNKRFAASHVAILVSQDTDQAMVVRDLATGEERVFGAGLVTA